VIFDHLEWILFAWVLGNQSGLPVPVVPALLGAGALAGSARLSLSRIIVVAVGASLSADLTWYGLGRWRGERMLRMLARLSPTAMPWSTVPGMCLSPMLEHFNWVLGSCPS